MIKISVIIPTYNSARFICKAIESVLSQTFKDFEIIVIDDGSTDNTGNVLNHYGDKIIYITQANRGVSSARNVGLKLAKSEYVAFLDADDTWLPGKLLESIRFLEAKNFDWICTSRFKVTEDGSISERKIEPESGIYNEKKVMDHLEIGLFDLNYILALPSTLLVKRNCFDIAGDFDETLKISEDLDLLMRFNEKGLVGGYLDVPLTIKRSYDTSLSKISRLANLAYTVKVAKRHAKILRLDKILRGKVYGNFWWEMALWYNAYGGKWQTLQCSLLSLCYYPQFKKLAKILSYGVRGII